MRSWRLPLHFYYYYVTITITLLLTEEGKEWVNEVQADRYIHAQGLAGSKSIQVLVETIHMDKNYAHLCICSQTCIVQWASVH